MATTTTNNERDEEFFESYYDDDSGAWSLRRISTVMPVAESEIEGPPDFEGPLPQDLSTTNVAHVDVAAATNDDSPPDSFEFESFYDDDSGAWSLRRVSVAS